MAVPASGAGNASFTASPLPRKSGFPPARMFQHFPCFQFAKGFAQRSIAGVLQCSKAPHGWNREIRIYRSVPLIPAVFPQGPRPVSSILICKRFPFACKCKWIFNVVPQERNPWVIAFSISGCKISFGTPHWGRGVIISQST